MSEIVTLTKIQQFLIKKHLRPIRVWFAVQKYWNVSNYVNKGNVGSGYELQVQEQPGHYFGYLGGLTVTSHKTYQHFYETSPGFVPNYYSWYQNP